MVAPSDLITRPIRSVSSIFRLIDKGGHRQAVFPAVGHAPAGSTFVGSYRMLTL